MPVVNGKYVAPVWVDGSSPAIDAEELNAMGQALEGMETEVEGIAPKPGDIMYSMRNSLGNG